MLKLKSLKKFISTMTLSIMITQPVYAATYKVLPNDSLYKISKLFNTSITQIKEDNNLTSDVIYPGQPLSVSSKTYTVVRGDFLYSIAKDHGISLDKIRIANNKWDNLIYPGDNLLIPSNSYNNGFSTFSGQSTVIPYTDSDLDLLARLVKAEAGGESFNTKVCVASVVINRVESNRFPNTIKDVIYEVSHGYYQFTPVLNGMINKPATSNEVDAALSALRGNDPTNGALYFFDDTVTNQWLLSKPVATQSDKMTFSY